MTERASLDLGQRRQPPDPAIVRDPARVIVSLPAGTTSLGTECS
jgi:hypothetical protein